MKSYLFALLLVFVASSAQSARMYRIDSIVGAFNDSPPPYCGISVGDIVDHNNVCAGYSWTYNGKERVRESSGYSSYEGFLLVYGDGGYFRLATVSYVGDSCADGSMVNPLTGICESEPQCGDDFELNPDTYECEPVPFCESSEVIDEFAIQSEACNASGGVFQYSCNELFQTADFSCLDKSNCIIGATNWPSCLGDIDPTENIDEPSGSFDSGTADTANPSAPWQKDEPDEVTPEETTDTAVLTAIKNMNRDQNQALGQISTDINQGIADTNTALNQLNLTNQALGQAVVDQMNQDYQLAESQRQSQTATTAAVMNGTSEITSALGLQTSSLTNAINGNGDKLDAINGSLGDIADLLGNDDECTPTLENNYCESNHGLNASEAQSLYGGIATAVTGEETSALQNLSNDINSRAGNSPTTSTDMENNAAGVLDIVPSLLDSGSGCVDLTLPTMRDDSVVISCEFSANAKAVISLAFYVYTIYTIGTLILSGITPNPSRRT